MKAIQEKVIDILKKYIYRDISIKSITGSSRLIDDLKINSARIVDIILDTEEQFGITIEDEQLEKLVTIDDIVNMIQAKQTR
ncbi:MAG: Acyl carrier protein [Bacteroidetes bacterium ADurb.Bin408]|nr:MAG: Acyl carrier protein [Bacteroidetes bacterium ADurb.Bin408]